MKGLKVAAVITLAHAGEDMSVGLESVRKLKDYFSELHIVYPRNYVTPDKDSIAVGIPYHPHYEELTTAILGNVLLVVHVRPDHDIGEPALLELLESAQENSRTCDHYAVRGRVDCDGERYPWLLGFVWLLSYMDWFRTWLNWWGYHTVDDLRAVKVVPRFPSGCHIPSYRHAWLFAVWSRIAWIRYNAQSLIVLARPEGGQEQKNPEGSTRPPAGGGWTTSLFFRNIYRHPHIGLWNMTWWVPFVVYYFFFALPWWNLLLRHAEYTDLFVRPSLYNAVSWLLWRNVWHPVWLALWGAQIVLCMWIVARRYKHVSLGWVVLMPVYLTLSPLVFMVVRTLSLPRAGGAGKGQNKH